MNLIQRTNKSYNDGRITSSDAVLKVLSSIDLAGPTNQLEGLDSDLIVATERFIQEYLPTRRSTAVELPSMEQIQYARDWCERQKPSRPAGPP